MQRAINFRPSLFANCVHGVNAILMALPAVDESTLKVGGCSVGRGSALHCLPALLLFSLLFLSLFCWRTNEVCSVMPEKTHTHTYTRVAKEKAIREYYEDDKKQRQTKKKRRNNNNAAAADKPCNRQRQQQQQQQTRCSPARCTPRFTRPRPQ